MSEGRDVKFQILFFVMYWLFVGLCEELGFLVKLVVRFQRNSLGKCYYNLYVRIVIYRRVSGKLMIYCLVEIF